NAAADTDAKGGTNNAKGGTSNAGGCTVVVDLESLHGNVCGRSVTAAPAPLFMGQSYEPGMTFEADVDRET
ncbi:MAG TPA: hypothetical protein VFC19_41495, partial [Candidatus Limnocylindrales bacterium]|nr:hypothetical protein [Candidatus Limnocylindrales bacterium]